MAVACLLEALEAISRTRPDRVLRLRGELAGAGGELEPFELLIFRGFSSSVSHPTSFDPDQPTLPASASVATAELLAAPLNPAAERQLAAPHPADIDRDPAAWS